MKAIILLALVLVAANSYTLWDRWHDKPTKWVAQSSPSTTYGVSGWKRNGENNEFHPSGEFTDSSAIFSRYLYWNVADPSILIICGPKYYLFSENLCKINPAFRDVAGQQAESCLPNYYGFAGKDDICGFSNPLYGTAKCCYENGITNSPAFLKDMTSVDPYPNPIN